MANFSKNYMNVCEPLAYSSTHLNEAIGIQKTQELLFRNGSVFLEKCTVAEYQAEL